MSLWPSALTGTVKRQQQRKNKPMTNQQQQQQINELLEKLGQINTLIQSYIDNDEAKAEYTLARIATVLETV